MLDSMHWVFSLIFRVLLTIHLGVCMADTQGLTICSHSQAALKALLSLLKPDQVLWPKLNWHSVNFPLLIVVHLLRVPGHNNVPGNEIADELAKQELHWNL